MGDLFFLVESLASGFYIVGGLTIAYFFRMLLSARHELRLAQFTLEREQAEQRGGRAVTGLLFTVNLLVAIWGTTTVAAPTWRDGLPEDSTTPQFQNFATSTPSNLGSFEVTISAGDTGPVIPVTAPPPSTPKGTILPADDRVGCIRDQAWIDTPTNGQVIFDVIPVEGTASIQDFAFYRFEIRADTPESMFAPIGGVQGDRTSPVIEGPLGSLNPLNYLEGAYRYRLVVFDSTSELRASCEISIFISDPIPTATPIGG